jgi:hypothetical protein
MMSMGPFVACGVAGALVSGDAEGGKRGMVLGGGGGRRGRLASRNSWRCGWGVGLVGAEHFAGAW